MSSPTFLPSPLNPRRTRRKSRFTYKNLTTLSQSSPHSPLRIIAHIDLDAFYAQCETVRLGIDPTKPLAVQQWQGLIAINYPARASGLTRHVTITEAKEKCPEIICQHVATWKEGETKWSYDLDGADAAKEIATRKVSLDPYRIQSRRILAVIKEALPQECQMVEKASIDEVFLDLSAQVHGILLERYPELHGPAPYDDPSEPLPRPPTTALDWAADALVDLDGTQSEEDDPDWDDICLLIASEIVRDVRKAVFDECNYTCSAGLSRNKMLAKLGSGHKKPNGQTVIRNRAISHFLSGFKFTKIRNLGGKLGDEVVAAFNTELVSELLPVSIEQLKRKLGDDTGSWLYSIIRGEDSSEVNPRTQIKSMLSAKSFRPSINSFEIACRWLRIFVADIYSRLVEEGVLENKRRPKTINLHHRQGAGTRSKQAPLPMGKMLTEELLYESAKGLLAQVIVDGRAWPCANLSLSVGGFEEGVTNNRGIGGFLVHGEEAKALRDQTRVGEEARHDSPPPKRRKVGITSFFGVPMRQESKGSEADVDDGRHGDEEAGTNRLDEQAMAPEEAEDDLYTAPDHAREQENHYLSPTKASQGAPPSSASLIDQIYPPTSSDKGSSDEDDQHPTDTGTSPPAYETTDQQPNFDSFNCTRCNLRLPAADKAEHEDFHFAQDLENEDRSETAPRPPPPKPPEMARPGSGQGTRGRGRGRGRPPSHTLGPERGQRRLAFG